MQRPSDLGFGDFPHSDLDLGILGDLKKKESEKYEDMHFGIICDSENLSLPKYTILRNDISI